jgi:hypothetical protein
MGMAPALSVLLLSLVGMVVVALVRAPFDTVVSWTTVALTLALGAGLHVMARRRAHRTTDLRIGVSAGT